MSDNVLDGVRVLEMADWIAGPFTTSILGDFGAEVIRIDLPGRWSIPERCTGWRTRTPSGPRFLPSLLTTRRVSPST